MKIEVEITEELQDKIAKTFLEECKDACIAYVHPTYHLESKEYADAAPLDVQFYIDHPGIGVVDRINLAEELLEIYGDDPTDETSARKRKDIIAALRKLADDLEALV